MRQSDKTSDQNTGRQYGNRSAAQRRAERDARLVDAGVELFSRDGFAGTSIEQLCAEASVSTRNFYESFGRREDLLGEIHDRLNERAMEAVADAVAGAPDDLAARVEAGIGAYLSVMTGDARWARVVLVEAVGVSPDMERRRFAATARFGALITSETSRLADLGLIARRDFALTAVIAVGGLKELVTTWATASPRPPIEELTAEAVRALLALFGADLTPVEAQAKRRNKSARGR